MLGLVIYDGKSYLIWVLGFGWCLGVVFMLFIFIFVFKLMFFMEGICS